MAEEFEQTEDDIADAILDELTYRGISVVIALNENGKYHAIAQQDETEWSVKREGETRLEAVTAVNGAVSEHLFGNEYVNRPDGMARRV